MRQANTTARYSGVVVVALAVLPYAKIISGARRKEQFELSIVSGSSRGNEAHLSRTSQSLVISAATAVSLPCADWRIDPRHRAPARVSPIQLPEQHPGLPFLQSIYP